MRAMRKGKHDAMYNVCGLAVFETSFGWAGIAASERGICKVILPGRDKNAVKKALRSEAGAISSISSSKLTDQGVKLLQKYFFGERVSFDLPLDLRYYTHFQRAVLRAAVEIPYGETRAYVWIARRIKSPRAARAVGQAMGANPIPIIIP
jgi:methylated-DNA-[protein]-cysteine S-methyltransferase